MESVTTRLEGLQAQGCPSDPAPGGSKAPSLPWSFLPSRSVSHFYAEPPSRPADLSIKKSEGLDPHSSAVLLTLH